MTDSVLEIAHRHLQKVKRSGPDNIMALCPFHDNRNTPSFTMSLSKGLYYCFSCGERGNLMTFLRSVGVSRSTIEYKYRFVLEELEKSRAKKKPRDIVITLPTLQNEAIPEWILGHFDKCPLSLIEDDAFEEDLLQRLDIGFDDKHMRITFPIRDIEGVLVGISGRTVVDDMPKYKIYDIEYKDFDLPIHKTYRSQIVWNGHMVYPQAYLSNEKAPVVIVEGFKACMRWLQAGFANVVAITGAFLSDVQKRLIERMASEVYFMLDQNNAGLRGTVLAGMRMGLPTRVIPYPDERPQPSDLLPEELLLAFSTARDFHRWLVETPPAMEIYRERRLRHQSSSEEPH